MRTFLMRSTLVAAMSGVLFLSACASVDDVKRAQATADSALEAAHGAQQTATQAQQTADQARSDVSALGQKVQGIQQDVDELKARHRGQRG